jgi:hypothetical protein
LVWKQEMNKRLRSCLTREEECLISAIRIDLIRDLVSTREGRGGRRGGEHANENASSQLVYERELPLMI